MNCNVDFFLFLFFQDFVCKTLSNEAVLFRYAPHYGIIMHTSYLPTGQRSRLKEVIQMQISSDINPRRRRNNQFFLSCFTRSASSFLFIRCTFLFWFAFSRRVPCSFTHICSFSRFTLFFSFRRLFGARPSTARVSLAHVVMSFR